MVWRRSTERGEATVADQYVRIPVSSEDEREQICVAMEDKEVRAFVRLVGALLPLPSDRARERVLRFVVDRVHEEAGSNRG